MDGKKKTMKVTSYATIFFGITVVSCSLVYNSVLQESTWTRQALVSFVVSSQNSENNGVLETNLMSTVTISKLGMTHLANNDKYQFSTDASRQEVAWLMSFPNSGTTYTMHNTEHVSMRSTASNYAMELHYKEERIPVRQESDNVANGPWQRNNTLPLAPLALTKTHCAGYDDRADLKHSIITADTFLQGCTKTTQYVDPSDQTNHDKMTTRYNHRGLVTSAVHLIRNPFDNVISRLHHGIKRRKKRLALADEEYHNLVESRDGVLAWCNISDKEFWGGYDVPTTLTDKNYLQQIQCDVNLLLSVPCHSEIFRYVQWHNAAIELIKREKLASLTMYYEDYETNYNQTLGSLLSFLNLSQKQSPLPFKEGKTYRNLFFSKRVQRNTWKLIETLASEEAWELLQRYFDNKDGNSAARLQEQEI